MAVLLVSPFFLFFTTNLMVFYLLLEIITFSFILLIALYKTKNSLTAAIQYLIYNAVASSFFLLGVIIIYSYTFSLNLQDISLFFYNYQFGHCSNDLYYLLNVDKLFVFGEFLIFFSLIWKMACFPLHFWIVDFYELIPVYLMAISSTILVFWYYLFFLYLAKYFFFGSLTFFIDLLFQIITIGSLVFGALGLITQINIKRFLAFSAIFNLGFLIMPTSLLTSQVISYLVLYVVSNLLIFFSISYYRYYYALSLNYFSDLKILKSNIYMLIPFVFAFLNISGLPPFPGFFLKYSLLSSLFNSYYSFFFILVLMVVLNTVATFAYLNILKVILFDVSDNYFELTNSHFLTLLNYSSDKNYFKNSFSFFSSTISSEFFLISKLNSLYFMFFLFFLICFVDPSFLYNFGLYIYSCL
jgi:NADH-quinone oxidoreductase subunit N